MDLVVVVVAGGDATVVAVSEAGAPGTKNGCAPRVKRRIGGLGRSADTAQLARRRRRCR